MVKFDLANNLDYFDQDNFLENIEEVSSNNTNTAHFFDIEKDCECSL